MLEIVKEGEKFKSLTTEVKFKSTKNKCLASNSSSLSFSFTVFQGGEVFS